MSDALVLIRLSGELSAKGRLTRRRFVDRLVHNLDDALAAAGLTCRIERRWARILVRGPADDSRPEAAADHIATVARRVFGVRDALPVTERAWRNLDDLLAVAAEHFGPEIADRTFAVRARRGETATDLPFRSPEVERRLGALLRPRAAGVDLETPQRLLRLEIERERVSLWTESRREEAGKPHDTVETAGPGGLPVGTEGRALVLFSGGFDSAVAAWRMLRRGVRVDFLVGLLGDFRGHEAQSDAVLDVARSLVGWCRGYRPRLFLVDLQPIVHELKERCPPALWQVVLKRQLLRVAAPLALRRHAGALVTGEAIGQVSSQTLPNLAVIERAVDLPIFRPLLTAEKHEILAEARHIGTHDASARVPELCALEAPRPETAATPEALVTAEQPLDAELPRRLADERVTIDLRSWVETARDDGVEVADSVDQLADRTVLDLRRDAQRRALPITGALAVDYPTVLEPDALDALDRARRYVVVCPVGVQSAHLAAVLRARGLDARALRGGQRALLRGGAEATFDPALAAALAPAVRD